MDSRVRLIVRIAIAAMVVLIAFLSARGIGNLIGQKVTSITPYKLNVTNAENIKVESKLAIPLEDVEGLVYNRNLFNQKAIASSEPEPVEETPVIDEPEVIEEIVGDGIRPVLTDMRVLLVGTQVASIPAYSIAMFMPLDGGAEARMVYLNEGDTLLKEARILKIVRNRVFMERTTQNNRLEYIDTRTTEQDLNDAKVAIEKQVEKEKQAEKVREKAAAEAEKKTADADAATAAPAEVVRKVGTDTYEVSRDVVEKIRKNPNSLKNNADYGPLPKVQPVHSGGKIGGFRLLGIESNSVYAQLGLKSGDTIIDVNGQQVDGPQKAMALFDALKPGQDIGIKINRGGQEKTLTFQLK